MEANQIVHEVWVATLKPEGVPHYEKMHREFPPENHREMTGAGYHRVEIVRHDLNLIMIVSRAVARLPGNVPNDALNTKWQAAVELCLERNWFRPTTIFLFEPTAATC